MTAAADTPNPRPEDPQPDTRAAFQCAVCGRSVADADAGACPVIRVIWGVGRDSVEVGPSVGRAE